MTRPLKDGAGSAGSRRRPARTLAVNQARPTQAVTATRPNAIQPSGREWTSVKPSQNARPVIPQAGWVTSTSDRNCGIIGSLLDFASDGGSHRSLTARRSSRRAARADLAGAAAEGPTAEGPAAEGPAAEGPAAEGPAAEGPAAAADSVAAEAGAALADGSGAAALGRRAPAATLCAATAL